MNKWFSCTEPFLIANFVRAIWFVHVYRFRWLLLLMMLLLLASRWLLEHRFNTGVVGKDLKFCCAIVRSASFFKVINLSRVSRSLAICAKVFSYTRPILEFQYLGFSAVSAQGFLGFQFNLL